MKRKSIIGLFCIAALAAGLVYIGQVAAQKDVPGARENKIVAGPLSNTPQTLPFSQDWTNPGLITVNDDWSGVPGIQGFLGQDITTSTGVDPRTLLTSSSVAPDLDVIANGTNPNTSTSGGVGEFIGIVGPPAVDTIALQGSGTADAPHIILYLNTTGQNNIRVTYNAKDIDGSADNAIQPINTQYRVGSTGNFINVAGGYVADASTGPSIATLVTQVAVTLPAAANNQPEVQVRIMTTNAVGSDEWIGIDDINVTTVATPAPNRTALDFNGDGKTDYSVIRNTGGGPDGQVTWYNCYNGVAEPGCYQFADWGLASDFFIPADYDGDGKTDIAFWRQGAPATAGFYIFQSGTSTVRYDNFGQTGDIPSVVADYTGDGKADPAVYREGATAVAQSFWYYRASSGTYSGKIVYEQWGQGGDSPVPGDYDGDGNADFMIQRDAGGGSGQSIFWLRTNQTNVVSNYIFGTPADEIVPGDYDGDGKTDIAVVRGINGSFNWFYRASSTGNIVYLGAFGLSTTDWAVQGDYDGDGKTDIAVWRPAADYTANYFYHLGSASGFNFHEWGQLGDYPVANYNTH